MNAIKQIGTDSKDIYENYRPDAKVDVRIKSIVCNLLGIGVALGIGIPLLLRKGDTLFTGPLISGISAIFFFYLAYSLVNRGNGYHQEAVVQSLNHLKKEPINVLTCSKTEIPTDICEEVFSFLTGPELIKCAKVNRDWYKVASRDRLWNVIVDRYSIGPKQWKNIDIGKADPLPKDILDILRSPCPFFEGKRVGETHMLVWIPKMLSGSPLTLDSLHKIVKVPESDYYGFTQYRSGVQNLYGNKSLEQHGWILMTKRQLPESRRKSYSEQKKMVERIDQYEVPKSLEAAFCIFAQYQASGKYLFSKPPKSLTRCQEGENGFKVLVGLLTPTSFCVFHGKENDESTCIGMAAVRRFST